MDEMVLIPRRLIQELSTYLENPSEQRVAVPGNGDWTQNMVAQLKEEIRANGYKGALATGDLAAQNAGSLVSLQDVVAASGIDKKQISSDLGAMSKAARRLFGKKIWPFRALEGGTGMSYLMSTEIEAWWRDA